jgi:hypothetical protein
MGLPLSAHQLDVLRELREPKTVVELARLLTLDGLPGHLQAVMRALHQRCLISYMGGRGVKAYKGRWQLTRYGAQTLRELGEIGPSDPLLTRTTM